MFWCHWIGDKNGPYKGPASSPQWSLSGPSVTWYNFSKWIKLKKITAALSLPSLTAKKVHISTSHQQRNLTNATNIMNQRMAMAWNKHSTKLYWKFKHGHCHRSKSVTELFYNADISFWSYMLNDQCIYTFVTSAVACTNLQKRS